VIARDKSCTAIWTFSGESRLGQRKYSPRISSSAGTYPGLSCRMCASTCTAFSLLVSYTRSASLVSSLRLRSTSSAIDAVTAVAAAVVPAAAATTAGADALPISGRAEPPLTVPLPANPLCGCEAAAGDSFCAEGATSTAGAGTGGDSVALSDVGDAICGGVVVR